MMIESVNNIRPVLKDPERPIIIAVCGKGGVGKTSISALLLKKLSEDQSRRILAVDADPAVGLSFNLGIQVRKTVDDIRRNLISMLEKGHATDKGELLSRLDYELFDSLEEKENLAFLAIGRPESAGCYCRVNELLKDIIRETAAGFDCVVIDGEAGVEQINRRVMEMVTHLLLVTDVSAKGRNVIGTIEQIAGALLKYKRVGVLCNRIKDEAEIEMIRHEIKLPVIGWIPEDNTIRTFDREGRSFFQFPVGNTLKKIGTALERLTMSG